MRKLLLLLSVAAIAAVGYRMTTHSDGANIQPTDQNTQVVSDSNQAAQSIENRLWFSLEDGCYCNRAELYGVVLQRVHAAGQHIPHLRNRAPPIIMVASHYHLFAW